MDVTSSGWLQYGALGLLALLLAGIGAGLKMLLPRWMTQVEAAIRVQEASATAMTAMATAMTALAASVVQHADMTKREHQAILDADKAILDAMCKKTRAPRAKAKPAP